MDTQGSRKSPTKEAICFAPCDQSNLDKTSSKKTTAKSIITFPPDLRISQAKTWLPSIWFINRLDLPYTFNKIFCAPNWNHIKGHTTSIQSAEQIKMKNKTIHTNHKRKRLHAKSLSLSLSLYYKVGILSFVVTFLPFFIFLFFPTIYPTAIPPLLPSRILTSCPATLFLNTIVHSYLTNQPSLYSLTFIFFVSPCSRLFFSAFFSLMYSRCYSIRYDKNLNR